MSSSEAHVWLLDWETSDLDDLKYLTPDEQSRASRFHFREDQLRFGLTRARLRRLLHQYLSVSWDELELELSAEGKPFLSTSMQGRPNALRFNVSHSGRYSLLAFAPQSEVGVDVEAIRPEVLAEQLSERFFSTEEQTTLDQLPSSQQLRGFFHCWTRKEAYLKALGEGLSRGLDTFSVAFDPSQPAALRSDGVCPTAPHSWRIVDLPLPDGYAGAVVVSRTIDHVRLLRCI
jgi:4'-phosphopantetheinyl transferase